MDVDQAIESLEGVAHPGQGAGGETGSLHRLEHLADPGGARHVADRLVGAAGADDLRQLPREGLVEPEALAEAARRLGIDPELHEGIRDRTAEVANALFELLGEVGDRGRTAHNLFIRMGLL